MGVRTDLQSTLIERINYIRHFFFANPIIYKKSINSDINSDNRRK